MGKRSKILATVLSALIAGMLSTQSLDESVFIKSHLVDHQKIWTLRFQEKIDFDRDIYSGIQLTDSNNQVQKTWLVPGDDGMSVEVRPYIGGYREGESYKLTVNENLCSLKGEPLELSEDIYFRIKESNFEVEKILDNGDDREKFVMVFMGDGYTESEQDKFKEDVQTIINKSLKEEPFLKYREDINVYIIKVISNFSGISAFPEDLQDTYFGTSFFYGSRKGSVGSNKYGSVNICLNNSNINYDRAFVLMNSKEHAGTARGDIAYLTASFEMADVFMHEFGHSFGRLRDEYNVKGTFVRGGVNLIDESDPEKVPWKDFIGKEGIGVYPLERSTSWYIPSNKCRMRFSGWPFCAVCRDHLDKKMEKLLNKKKSEIGQGD